MLSERSRILIETITRLLHRGANDRLKKVIGKAHEADLIPVFRSLSLSNQCKLFNLIDDPEIKGYVISELDEDIIHAIIEDLPIEELVHIMDQMPDDDRAALIKMLPEDKAETVLEIMKKKGSEDVEELLLYAEDTAGSIMTADFMASKE
nr:magnesium transporter [Desulfobacterales bacterium]